MRIVYQSELNCIMRKIGIKAYLSKINSLPRNFILSFLLLLFIKFIIMIKPFFRFQIFKYKQSRSKIPLIFLKMNNKSRSFFLILSIIISLKASTFQQLDNLVQQKFSDQVSVIRLANQQKFSIPLNGRYISYNITYSPQNSNDCSFRQPTVQYKKLAQSNKLFDQDDQIIATLVLKRQQKIILADPYFNIVLYSTDEHKLLRLLSPKTSLLDANSHQKGNKKPMISSLSMITTQQQDYIYYLSSQNSFVFSAKSFGTQIQKLNITLPLIQKAIYYKNFVVILTNEEGLLVYKLNKKDHTLEKVQTLKNIKNHQFIDIELNKQDQMFYVLTQNSIQVYLFDPSNFPSPSNPKQFLILRNQDEISIANYTQNHVGGPLENNQHLNLQISKRSSTQGSTQLFVLFRHLRQNIIAQFIYQPASKQITFLRYFKFQMLIRQIHTIEDVIVVVGNEILGMFPYGIDPRLIKEEFNGWMALSNIEKVVITNNKEFDPIWRVALLTISGSQLSVQLIVQNNIQRIINFQGNLTTCNKDSNHQYNTYCSYNKKFILQQMDIVTTSTISSSVWIVMLVCTIGIILGILIMLIMHKKKQDEIKKLELFFEQRRRTEVPQSSDRRNINRM